MPQQSDNFEVFLRALRRRCAASRCVDGATIGLAAGTVAAMGMVGWAVLRGGMAAGGGAILWVMGGAIAAGVAVAAYFRPTPAAIARRADRLLGLDELFSTALYLRSRGGRDAWASAVVACADGAAARLRGAGELRTVAGPMIGGRIRAAAVLMAAAVAGFSGLADRSSINGTIVGRGGEQVIAVGSDGTGKVYELRPPTPGGIEAKDELASRGAMDEDGGAAGSARASDGGDAREARRAGDAADGGGSGEAHTDGARVALPRDLGTAKISQSGGEIAGGGIAAKRGEDREGDLGPMTAMAANGANSQIPLRGAAGASSAGNLAVTREDLATDPQADLVRDFFGLSQP